MDDPLAFYGDSGWVGFRSRQDPVILPDGIAAISENIRFNRGRAEVRKGSKRLSTNISPANSPVVIPFQLANDVAVSSITRAGATATVTTSAAHGYSDGSQLNIRGANETEYNGDFVIVLINATQFSYTVGGTPATPATGTILANNGPILRNSYSGGIFAAAVFSSPNSTTTNNGDEWIALFGPDSCFFFRDGQTVFTKTYPSNEVIEQEDDIAVVQAFNNLFLFRSRQINGSYSRKACGITNAAGVATVTTGVVHLFSTGNRISIEGANEAAYNIEVDITVTGANTFTYPISFAPASPATGTITCRLVKPPLYWDGGTGNFVVSPGGNNAAGATFSNLRATSIAAYTNNQLVIVPTPIKDSVMVSDVLDYNTFDSLLKSFRANAGSNDEIVAIHPFAEGDILVFGKKSIYRAHIEIASDGQSIDTSTSFIELLTSEIGCIAKNTIVTSGAFVYFLSDSGVYRLDSNYSDLKVRGVSVPLSDFISDQFDNLNYNAVGLSTAVWFNSRYYLTVPIGVDDAPNTLLVWSSINNEWESVDRYPYGIHSLLVSDYGSKRRLFGSSRAGALYLLEELETGDDPADPLVTSTVDIAGRLRTRSYGSGSLSSKRFNQSLSSVSLPAGATILVKINTYDPDASVSLGSQGNSSSSTEEYVLKYYAKRMGTFADVEFTSSGSYRPVVRSEQLSAFLSDPQFTTRTLE